MLKRPWQEPEVLVAHRDRHISTECPPVHTLSGAWEDGVKRRPNLEPVAVTGGPDHGLDSVHSTECPGWATDLHHHLSLPVCIKELTHWDRELPPLGGELEAAGSYEGLDVRCLISELRF